MLFSYVGPKCAKFHTFAASYVGALLGPNGESIFLTDLRFKGIDSQILFAFNVKVDGDISSEEVKIYIKVKDRAGSQSIKDYLASAAVQEISSVKIVK